MRSPVDGTGRGPRSDASRSRGATASVRPRFAVEAASTRVAEIGTENLCYPRLLLISAAASQ